MSDDLGFYFLIYQPNPLTHFCKVFIDGNEDFTFMTDQDLIDLASTQNMSPIMKSSLKETSMFLWDAQGKTIKRLSSRQQELRASEILAKKSHVDDYSESPLSSKEEVDKKFWHADVSRGYRT